MDHSNRTLGLGIFALIVLAVLYYIWAYIVMRASTASTVIKWFLGCCGKASRLMRNRNGRAIFLVAQLCHRWTWRRGRRLTQICAAII